MPGPSSRQRLGRSGESHARRFLEAQGYTFVEGNWSCRAGEIDLVMRDGMEIVFVEVKTRHGERMGRAEEAVSASKAARLLAASEWYLAEHPDVADAIWRCDIVAVTLDRTHRVVSVLHHPNSVVTG